MLGCLVGGCLGERGVGGTYSERFGAGGGVVRLAVSALGGVARGAVAGVTGGAALLALELRSQAACSLCCGSSEGLHGVWMRQ